MKMKRILRPLAALLTLAAVLVMAGCMGASSESDLPWNTPANWEGSPSIPGMTPDY